MVEVVVLKKGEYLKIGVSRPVTGQEKGRKGNSSFAVSLHLHLH